MFGASQASDLRRTINRIVGGEAAIQKPTAEVKNSAAPTAAMTTIVTTEDTMINDAESTSAAPNIVDLVGDSEIIVRGLVKEVADGFENGVPFTQVTVQVSEALRGTVKIHSPFFEVI